MTAAAERYAGRLAVAGEEHGAAVAYHAILDLLNRHGLHDAREAVELCGEEAIRVAFLAQAWSDEDIPSAGDAAETHVNNAARMPQETQCQSHSTKEGALLPDSSSRTTATTPSSASVTRK